MHASSSGRTAAGGRAAWVVPTRRPTTQRRPGRLAAQAAPPDGPPTSTGRPRSPSPIRAAARSTVEASTTQLTLPDTATPSRCAPPPPTSLPPSDTLDTECAYLAGLVDDLTQAGNDDARVALLRANGRVREYLSSCSLAPAMVESAAALGPAALALVLTLPAIGQAHVLSVAPPGGPPALASAMADLVTFLSAVHRFYDAIGGLVGYQLACLRLMRRPGGGLCGGGARPPPPRATARLHRPPGLDLSDDSPEGQAAARAAAAAGLAAGPSLAEILPLGGAGDRLGLVCPATGDPLPAALLPFAGRTLLDGVMRDLQAREYLRWRVMGDAPAPAGGGGVPEGGGAGGGGRAPPPAPTRCRPPPPTPVVVMTSDAKGNHARVEALLAAAGWYGRGRDAFRLVRQPLVPLLAAAHPAPGRWLLRGPLSLEARPGGHGALWKLMADGGAFDWLAAHGRTAALVRQISNPLAGTDATLLALAGVGVARAAAAGGGTGQPGFGFVACPRRPGAAEGVVALRERVEGGTAAYGVTNVEYTEWGAGAGGGGGGRGGSGGGGGGGGGGGDGATTVTAATTTRTAPPPDLPANTNVLFVGLEAASAAVSASSAAAGSASAALPGLVFNASKAVTFPDAASGGAPTTTRAGRLECTMQALADHWPGPTGAPAASSGGRAADLASVAASIPTFALHAARRQVTSSAKRAAPPGVDLLAHPASAAQTPDGAYADAAANAADLLRRCGVAVPPGAGGPGTAGTARGLAFHWHPALGPLWAVIAQKVRGGSMAPGSELVLDVAEAAVTGLRLDGSLLVTADAPLGHWESGGGGGGDGDGGQPRLVYSHRAGRIRLSGVTVSNAGVDWSAPGTQAWSRRLSRPAGCARVTLRGQAEFDAADCVLAGDLAFDVPPGYRMSVRADRWSKDGLRRTLTRLPRAGAGEGGGRAPTWEWAARWGPGGAVVLDMVEGAAGRTGGGASPGAARAEPPPDAVEPPCEPPCDWSTSLDAFAHESCGSVPPWLDARTGPVVLSPPVEAGAWEI